MELSSRFQAILPRLAAGAALLTCFAVVFNIGGVGQVGGLERAPMTAVPTFVSAPIALSERGKDPEPPPALTPPLDLSVFQVFEPQSSPIHDIGGGMPLSAVQSHNSIVGIWAPDTSSCSLREFRQGLLPTIINTEGAWAGDTFCSFKNQKQTDTGWRVVATCANTTEQWTTPVRLTIKGSRLTWASKRGMQTYTRCTPNLHMADVQ